jgi:two-component system, NtrC family, nitrogen regulation response regulator GlnG
VAARSGDDAPSTVVRAVSRGGQGDGDLRALAPALTILWHYDLDRVGTSAPLGRTRTDVSRHTAPFDLVIDSALSRAPFLVVDHKNGAVTLSSGATNTEVLIDGIPLTGPQHVNAQRLKHGVILMLAERIVVCLHHLRTPVLRGPDLGFVGGSDVMEEVRRQIRKVADLDVPVLIRGQSGTGKELVARAIAAASAAPTPYRAVNMAALGQTMALADLFGHEKGAFTGATADRPGYFVEADGGTLFLDEIGDAAMDVQRYLLRVLDTGEVRPLGGRRDRKVRVRLLTATDKDLEAAVASGSFDGPLLNRIRRYRIDLPTLAERREDIGSLFLHFLKKKLQATGELHRLARCQAGERPWLGAFDFVRIARAPYDGNLRDLDSLATEIAVDSRGKPFAVFGPGAEKILAGAPPSTPAAVVAPAARRPGQPTDEEIKAVLRQHNNNVAAAAKALGIHRSTLYERARLEPSLMRGVESLTDQQVLEACERHQGDVAKMAGELGVSAKPLKTRLDAALRRRR